MKIAVLSPVAWRTPPRHYGPWEQVASNVAEGLVAAGHEVTLFATGDSLTAGTLAAVIPVGYEEDRQTDAKVAECLHISHLMERAGEFDLVHNHFDFLPLCWSRLIPTPMITTIHGFSSPKIIPVYQKYNDHTHYVSISNADRSSELRYIGTVYNGLDTAAFSLGEAPADDLLFFGRIHPDKGTWEAIQIAKKTKKRLIIAGIVQDASYFDEKVKPFLSDDIQFIGEAGPEKRNDLLGNALALLHPINFNEPFGMSVAEAMMCGTPVIAFNRGSMPELIDDGKTGFLVTTPDEAAEAVQQLPSIDRVHTRNRAISRFSKETMVSDYLEQYRKIVG